MTGLIYTQQLEEIFKKTKLEVEYWDIRIEDTFTTLIGITKGEITSCSASPSIGAFIRLRKNGFWFYKSTTDLENLAQDLRDLANQPDDFGSPAKVLKFEKQPAYFNIASKDNRLSAVALDKKLELVKTYEGLVRKQNLVQSTSVRYQDFYKIKSFINSVGTQFEYDFNQCGFVLSYILKEGENLFEDMTKVYGSRFEDLLGQETSILEFVEDSKPFLAAPAITPGKYKVLLDPEVAGVFTHESFGHKSEADGMVGNDEALAEWTLGKKIASDCLSIVDQGSHSSTSGYCPVDDEGTPAQKNYLIKNGSLVGRLHSVETATDLDEKPTGNARALNFEYEPIVRMTSTYIEPGQESLEAIMKRSAGAILLEGYKHGSGLSTFTIAPIRGYLLGPRGEKSPVRVTVISGSVFETLKNIEAVSKDFVLGSSSVGGCGKMEQSPLPVADGGPYVLINGMQVS